VSHVNTFRLADFCNAAPHAFYLAVVYFGQVLVSCRCRRFFAWAVCITMKRVFIDFIIILVAVIVAKLAAIYFFYGF
jgi:hypothetical protein